MQVPQAKPNWPHFVLFVAKGLHSVKPKREDQNAAEIAEVLHPDQVGLSQRTAPKSFQEVSLLLDLVPHFLNGLIELRDLLGHGNLLLNGKYIESLDGRERGPRSLESRLLAGRAGVVCVVFILGGLEWGKDMAVSSACVALKPLHIDPQELEKEVLGARNAVSSRQQKGQCG